MKRSRSRKQRGSGIVGAGIWLSSRRVASRQPRAQINKDEGIKQAKILEAEGEAQAIQLVNQAADKFFVGNAQLLRKPITVETALATNSKIVIPSNTQLINIVGDMAGILPPNGARPITDVARPMPQPNLDARRFGDLGASNQDDRPAEEAR